MIKSLKIISGGQSGVDRAALDFALQNHILCGGWCPKGRLAEDGKLHSKYPLKETVSSEYRIRTKANVTVSDGTLILYQDKLGKGTELTRNIARHENKACYMIELTQIKTDIIVEFNRWLSENKVMTLNIAGPRESESPGIYSKTMDFLESVIALTKD